MKYCFGNILREVRKRKKMTMKTVAEIVGVSESLISQIETDKVSPAIDTLLRITDALNIDFEYLFQKYKREIKVHITKQKDRKKIIDGPVCYEILSQMESMDKEHILEAYQLEIKPGQNRKDKEYGHKGSELGIIVEGKAEIIIGRETYSLSTGDCVSFNSDEPHTLYNVGDNILKSYWVITPPKSFN